MPSTPSNSLRLELMATGEASGTWGNNTNNNLGTLLEQAIVGSSNIVMLDVDYTLTAFNYVADEARSLFLNVTGTNTAVRSVIAPLVKKLYVVKNGTTGGFAITIKGATGTTVLVGNGAIVFVYCDGVNFFAVTPSTTTSSVGIQFKNRIINGAMTIAQRATTSTVTAGINVPTANSGYPCVDRWFVYSTGANVPAAKIVGSGNVKNRLQIAGASFVSAIGVGQRIESFNSYDLVGGSVTLSVDLANSLLTIVTWTVSYANTENNFGTIGSPTKTQIATGSWTITSTVTNYQAIIAIPAGAVTGLEVLFTVGAQTSGVWTIGNVQLESGAIATGFEQRPYQSEMNMCLRHYEEGSGNHGGYSGAGQNNFVNMRFEVAKFNVPAVTYTPVFTSNVNVFDFRNITAVGGLWYATAVSLGHYEWQGNWTASAEIP